jgi:transposase
VLGGHLGSCDSGCVTTAECEEPQVHAQSTDVDVVEVLTGLYGFRVKTAREADRLLEVEVESAAGEAACPECGVFSASLKQGPGRPQRLRDAPSFGRRVTVWWWKRRFRCLTPGCPKRSFMERSPLVAPRARTTERLRDLTHRWVRTRPVSEVASEVGVAWQTVWRWTRPRIEAALDGRQVPVRLGLDETSFRRPQRFATGLVDLDSGRLHDLLEGRSGRIVASWLQEHEAADPGSPKRPWTPTPGSCEPSVTTPERQWCWTTST